MRYVTLTVGERQDTPYLDNRHMVTIYGERISESGGANTPGGYRITYRTPDGDMAHVYRAVINLESWTLEAQP